MNDALAMPCRTRSADAEELLSFLREAVPFHGSPGGVRVRLLRSIDDPTRSIEIIEYDDRDAFEKDQHKVASDSQMRGYRQTWHSLLAGGVGIETYEGITGSIESIEAAQASYYASGVSDSLDLAQAIPEERCSSSGQAPSQ